MKPKNGYVLYIYITMQDGHEEGAKCFDSIEGAMHYINKERWPGDQYTYRLFELGKEIPMTTSVEEEAQPSKKMTVYKVKK